MDPSPSAHVAGVRLGQIKRGFFPVSEPHIDDAVLPDPRASYKSLGPT